VLLSEEKIRERKLRRLFVGYAHLAERRNAKWCDYWTHYGIDSPTRPPQSRTRHTIILTTLLTLLLRLLAYKSSYSSLVQHSTPTSKRHIGTSWRGMTRINYTHVNGTQTKHNESNFQVLAHTGTIAFELNKLWLKIWWQESKRSKIPYGRVFQLMT
jgi:hypothetical protein